MDKRLMIPGPVPLEDAVLQALGSPVSVHYGSEFVSVYNDMLRLLGQIMGTSHSVLSLVGSGSAGLDAALGSLLSPGDKVLVGANGFHGTRLAQMAQAHGAEVVEVQAPWGEPVLPGMFEEKLRLDSSPIAIIVTHVETTTGVLNPIPEIAEVARKHRVLIMVDAVASLGGLEFFMDKWGVDICCSASQKCLGGPAGLAQVALSDRAWAAIESRRSAPRSWYLDLLTWRKYAQEWADWHPYPVTVPTNLVVALRTALQSLVQESVAKRSEHYRKLMSHLRCGVQSLGLQPLVAHEWAAPVVTAVRSPRGVPSEDIVEFMAEEYGIKIGGGFGPLHNKVVRIGHMAASHTLQDIDAVLAGLQAFLKNRLTD